MDAKLLDCLTPETLAQMVADLHEAEMFTEAHECKLALYRNCGERDGVSLISQYRYKMDYHSVLIP